MSEIHTATSTPKGRELVAAVLAEFDRWAEHAAGQAAGVYPSDPLSAVRYGIHYLRTDLADHLIVPLGVLLASWGIVEGDDESPDEAHDMEGRQ